MVNNLFVLGKVFSGRPTKHGDEETRACCHDDKHVIVTPLSLFLLNGARPTSVFNEFASQKRTFLHFCVVEIKQLRNVHTFSSCSIAGRSCNFHFPSLLAKQTL